MARETESLFRLVMNDHEFLSHDDVHNIEKRPTNKVKQGFSNDRKPGKLRSI